MKHVGDYRSKNRKYNKESASTCASQTSAILVSLKLLLSNKYLKICIYLSVMGQEVQQS